MRIKININVKVGRLVKYFVLSDLFLLAGWGFIEPIFSVFIVQKVAGATLATVGIAAAIYWLLKSLLELPIASFLDNTPGEKDDFLALEGGLLLGAFSAIGFTWVTQIWQLYLVQAIHAIAFALYVPSWSAMFSRHLDKDRISFDWSLDSTAAGVSAGLTGLASGIIAEWIGFSGVFILAGGFAMLAALVIIAAPDLILLKPAPRAIVAREDHTPADLEI